VGRDAAADCFQDTVVTALRNYDGLRDDRNLRAWLFAVAHSRAMDGRRRRAREPVAAESVPEGSSPPPDAPDDLLWRSVRALPDKQREAVVLRFVSDLPYRDIGAVIGSTEAAARQNVRAGLQRLREVLT
jgi:RNA polymerase sigma factor (sigma-70 family)